MVLTLRVDLDYVPWDTPDATEYGHGEPAYLLRLLDLGRHTGYKFHFFASNRVLRAFPSATEAVLNDGHDLDWFCKHPEDPAARYEEALTLFAPIGHFPIGMGIRGSWPNESPNWDRDPKLAFLSACPGPSPKGLRLFPAETRTLRDWIRSGATTRSWTESTKLLLRDTASRSLFQTVTVRPQVLARHDPKLLHLREVLDFATALDVPILTFRDILRFGQATSE
jgi:hypothetical protein